MNDIAMPSLSIACTGACKAPAIRLPGQVLSPTANLLGLRVEASDVGTWNRVSAENQYGTNVGAHGSK